MMPMEADDISRYSEKELIVAIATGMDHQKDTIASLRTDMIKEFTDIKTTQERLELRIDQVEKRQDVIDTLIGSAKWLLGLLLVPYIGLIISLLAR